MMDSYTDQVSVLQHQHETAEPFYLSTFYQPNGDNKLHSFLKSVYRPEYENNFRIIIVQDCVDVYDYTDLPGRAICALQKHASQLDISNYFIVLVTANPNIDHELEQVRTLYSTDACKIHSHLVPDLDYKITYAKQDTFCVLPWIHLYVGTDGNVLPCCQADHDFAMGNIKEQSIDSILKSTKFNQLRENMLNGQRTKECQRCYAEEDSGLPSARTYHNSRWTDFTPSKINFTSSIENFNPVYLDIRLSNICNLKCRMCSGYFSSAIEQEEIELFGSVKSRESSMRLKQRKNSVKEILNYLPQAEKIYFAGGEPLLSEEHYDMLDALIACGNTDLEIIYNTNFTTLAYRERNVLDLWKHFSNVKIGASLDAHGNVAEYVRHGTIWKTIESNLDIVKTHCPQVEFTVTSTVGLLNAKSLMELQKQWHTTGQLEIYKFSLSVMISPPHLTVTALPLNFKNQLDKDITAHIAWCKNNGADKLAIQWANVLKYMWSQDHSHHLSEFRRLTKLMDVYRKESLAQAIPELADLIEENIS